MYLGRTKDAFKEAFKKKEINPEMIEKMELEKNDVLAIMIASASVIVPVMLIIFAIIALIILFMFYR